MTKSLVKWALLSVSVGILAGAAAFCFFKALGWAIDFRKAHSWIVVFLPIVGVLVAWFYNHYGLTVDGGNNLILDEIHEPREHIPFRIVPMIFISTVVSHLFGASVGREGAVVQMGSGISDQFSKFAGTFFDNRRIVLMVGMGGGFAALFGTPLAGAVFSIEILLLSSVNFEALFPCLVAALVGDYTAHTLGIVHFNYKPLIHIPPFSIPSLFSAIVAGVIFGLVAKFFVWSLHALKDLLKNKIPNSLYRPFLGGMIVVLFFTLFGSDRYQSLGEDVIHATFLERVHPYDFLGKIFMTVTSVGSGFRGGEVTSLFYIGATLGNALSLILPMAFPLLSALGFVAVFAGASNTPISCLFLSMSLFGSEIGAYAAITIGLSYLFSGQNGIYHSHRQHRLKKIFVNHYN